MRKLHSLMSAVLALSVAAACADSPVAPTAPAAGSSALLAASGDAYVDVTAGSNFSCGLRASGAIVCWGDNADGQLNVPAGTYKSVDASAFQNNVCAIRTDDTLACWGASGEGMSSPPAGTFKDVSMGLVTACGIRTDGTAACWGREWWMTIYTLDWIDNSNFVKVASGFEYSCGLKTDGYLTCWGGGGVGQTNPPNHAGPFTAVSAGYSGSCALQATGGLVCWGNRFGTEGVAPAGSNWSSVAGGAVGYCATNSSGGIACGHSDYPDLFVNNAPAGQYVQVDMGGSHACGILTDGSVRCWSGSPAPLPFSIVPPVVNTAPTVNAFAGATIFVGEQYSSSGSFSDPDADTFSATVNYGSGAGPLALAGDTFSLSHTYATAGTYTVTVSVSDGAASGTASAVVTVLSPAAAASTLESQVNTLVGSSEMSASDAAGLKATVSSAVEALAAGKVTAGNNKLDAFINQVSALEKSKRISPATAAALRDGAQRVKASTGGGKNNK